MTKTWHKNACNMAINIIILFISGVLLQTDVVLLQDPMDEWNLHWSSFGTTGITSTYCSSSTCFISQGIKFDDISTAEYTNIRAVFDLHIRNLNPDEYIQVYYNVNGIKQANDILIYNASYNDKTLSTQTFELSNNYASNKCELSIVFDFVWDGTWPVNGYFYLDNFYIYGEYYTPNNLPVCTEEPTVNPTPSPS